jgi:DNA-directed RNA polymerase subunit M/transcription elongation factor TFIIS
MKPKSQFHKSSTNLDGLQTWCIDCINEYKREWRKRKRSPEKQEQMNRVKLNCRLLKDGLKKCSMCNEIKSLGEFWAGEGTGDLRAECKDCRYEIEIETPRIRDSSRVVSYEKKARLRMWRYIKDQGIERPVSCPICGNTPLSKRRIEIVFHHTNGYEDDNWCFGEFVCSRCHRKIHDGKLAVEGKSWLK